MWSGSSRSDSMRLEHPRGSHVGRTRHQFPVPAARLLPLALGAAAFGAVAIGALAIGRLAVGRLMIKKARVGALEVDELTVRRLRVLEQEGPNS